MARNSQTTAAQVSPTSQVKDNPAVSLMAGLADVPQPGPTPEIVIGEVPAKPKPVPAPAPEVVYGDDGSITIK